MAKQPEIRAVKYKHMRNFTLTIIIFIITVFPGNASSETIILENGDRISGRISSENSEELILVSGMVGEVSIPKKNIIKIEGGPEKDIPPDDLPGKGPEVIWSGNISLGYDISRGNTKTEDLYGDMLVNRNNRHVDEITFAGNGFYSTADRNMSAQKWYTMGRYAYSFGYRKHFYNFFKLEADHDRFAGIYLRTVPSVGFGYWFFDEENIKLMAEVGLGWRRTDHYNGKKTVNEMVLIPGGHYEQVLFRGTRVTGDIYWYPSLKDIGDDYIMKSEAAVISELNDMLSMKVSLMDEFNARPASEDTKNHDTRIISSLMLSY